MAGQIKQMIDNIVTARAKGNETIMITTKTKILLKGVDPEQFTVQSPDDPVILEKLRTMAVEFGVTI